MTEKTELYLPDLTLENEIKLNPEGKFVVDDSEWIGLLSTLGGPFLFIGFLLLLSWIF